MSIALLELAAATVGLWITDPAAPAPRPTRDVDVIVEVSSRGRFHEFEERLRRQGFREDADSGVICRWCHGELILVATKLEAFADRGRDDYMGSRDFADVVSLLDGRAELVATIISAGG